MTLTKTDTAFLKGIAILMIVLHNFCHHLPMSVTENEYTFSPDRILRLWHYCCQGGPHVVLNLFSHFGHYGVPLFLFLSGYGLVRKYEKNAVPMLSLPGHIRADAGFILTHARKLWRLMLPAIAIYWAWVMWSGGAWKVSATDLLAMVTFTSNLLIKRNLILGPWWFFSLILQLYIIYRIIFYHFRSQRVLLGVTALFFLIQAFLYFAYVRLTPDGRIALFDTDPYHTDLFNYGRYNALAWLLPFAAGIFAARSQWAENCKPSRTTLIACSLTGTLLLAVAALDAFQWLLSPLYLLLAMLPMAFLVKGKTWRKAMEWTGTISATIFALHPIARAVTITAAKNAERTGQWMLTYCHIALYLLLTFFSAWVLNAVLGWYTRKCHGALPPKS